MKKFFLVRSLCALLALVLLCALMVPVLSVGSDDEVVLDPFEYGTKTAFADNLPDYDAATGLVTWKGGWQVGNYNIASGTFTPFTVMDESGILSTAGTVWGAGGGLYVTNNAGKIALSACMPADALTNEIRYTATKSGRAVLNYDRLMAMRETAKAADHIAYEFAIYLNGNQIWPYHADWFTYQSEMLYTDANVEIDALADLRRGGFPIAVTLEIGDVISFRTRQHNVNTWMIYENPTVTYTQTEHEHTWGAWSRADETQHVRTCATCGRDGYADHRWNSGEQTLAPTHTKEGLMTYTCLDCKATKTAPIAKDPAHSYDGPWEPVDGEQHKRACACGEAWEYGEHQWNAGAVTTPPTVFAPGVLTYTCTDCGAEKTAPLAQLTKIAGDVDGDGSDTNADVLCLFLYIYNAEENPLPLFEMADVDGDGAITNGDVLCIFRYMYNAEENPLYFPMSPEEENELPIDSVMGL